MKLNFSLPEEDVKFLDSYAREQGFGSRSAVLHKAVRLLRGAELGAAYEDAFVEWEQTGEAAEQVRAVTIERVGTRVGAVPAAVMTDVDKALRLHVAL